MNKDRLPIEILSHYGIRSPKIELLRETEYNAVYLVHHIPKKVLRVGYRTRPEDILFELDVIAFLNSAGVPVAMWNRTADNKPFVAIPGSWTAVLFDYISGFHPLADVKHLPNRNETYAAGKMLALIHTAGKKFGTTARRKRTVHSELERAIEAKNIFTEQYEGGREFISEVQSSLLFAQQYQYSPTIVHNDYRVHNVFFSSDSHIHAVIDFDWSCRGPAIKDVAHAALEWSFPDGRSKPDTVLLKTFLSGYNSVARDVVVYDQKFIDWIKFSALSDAATYFCDRFDAEGLKKKISRSHMYQKFRYFGEQRMEW